MDIPYNKEYIIPLEYTSENHIIGAMWYNNVLYILTMTKLISTTDLIDYKILIDNMQNIVRCNTFKTNKIFFRPTFFFVWLNTFKAKKKCFVKFFFH